jgi:hypothetical protein
MFEKQNANATKPIERNYKNYYSFYDTSLAYF